MSSILQREAVLSQTGRGLNIQRQGRRVPGPTAPIRSTRKGNRPSGGDGVATAETSFHKVLRKENQRITAAAGGTSSPSGEATGWITHTVQKGDTLWALAVRKYHVNLNELIRDNGIKDPKALQPGQELRVRVNRYPAEELDVVGSWYGEPYHGRPMANGEIYNMHAATIAHRTLPLGTQVEIKNPETGAKVKAVVTDRGPFVGGRDVDLSYGLAKKLSFLEKGVGKLLMRILGKRGGTGRPSDASPGKEAPERQGA